MSDLTAEPPARDPLGRAPSARSKGDDRRREIAEAALRCLERVGYAEVTARKVAAEADELRGVAGDAGDLLGVRVDPAQGHDIQGEMRTRARPGVGEQIDRPPVHDGVAHLLLREVRAPRRPRKT